MAHDIEHLRREIEALEKQLAAQHFGSLFDRKRIEQLEDKLKKKRKELARLQAGDDHEELEHGVDHVEIPEFAGAIEETPDLGPDFPLGVDSEEPPVRKPTVKSAVKAVGKSVAKVVKKVTSKPKPAVKSKPKPKTAPKKKAAAKPTKKKSKR